MRSLPAWMQPQADRDTAWAGIHPPRRSPARRTLNGMARLVADLAAYEAVAERAGLLQRLEPRAKVLGLIGLLVIVTLVHDPVPLALACVLAVVLAVVSRVPLRRMALAWLAAPLFTAAIMLPATLNIVTPGDPLWILAHTAGRLGPWRVPETLAVTDAGLLFAARFLLRTTACVSLALLLAVTTRPARLFRGLRALGVPKLFIMVLLMMERYLAVMMHAAEEIHEARISRAIASGTLRQEQAWVAAGMGALFRRTQRLGHEVYLAMIARGYTGEVSLLEDARWTAADWLFLAGAAAAGAGLLLV